MMMQSRRDERGRTATVLDAARSGDMAAWADIVRRYEGTVRAAVAAYRLGPAESADAIQNTWLRLVEHSAAIRDGEKLGSWLTTTARRECIALIRHHRIERACATIDLGQASPELTPEAAAILSEARRRVRSATNALPSRQREVIDGLYYKPCASYAEVARRTGMPIGSIGPTRLRSLRYLRHNLSDLQF
jgi:RNA polymerase sigma factor (sigma-70 family)